MTFVYAILLVLLNALWLFLNLVGLPGNWLIVITTALVIWGQWNGADHLFSVSTLVTVTVLAVLAEILELGAGAVGAKQAGASRRGSIGALLGGIPGAVAGTFVIPVPVIGSIIGACAGAFLGALYMEFSGGRSITDSVRSGVGAGKGRLLGTLIKIGIGTAIWLIVSIATFWPS